MGLLIYGVGPAIEVEDRALAHLQSVIITKLRRDESFSFTWGNDDPDVDGDQSRPTSPHGCVWISKSSALYFRYEQTPTRRLNALWLQEMAALAASNAGLRAIPEPSPSHSESQKDPRATSGGAPEPREGDRSDSGQVG